MKDEKILSNEELMDITAGFDFKKLAVDISKFFPVVAYAVGPVIGSLVSSTKNK